MAVYELRDNSIINNDIAAIPIIKRLMGKSLEELFAENILVFPPSLKESDDLDQGNVVFRKYRGEIYTSNIVGFLSDSRDEIKIFSRFSDNQGQDYFLRYMFSKVLNFNITSNKLSSSDDLSYEKLILLLFPAYFKNALSKGVYKEYVSRKYNDLNVRGRIDIARHIKNNIPFEGKISFNTREFSFDNKVTQLIRHTIEFLEQNYAFLLYDDPEIREQILIFKNYTGSYSKIDREKILFENKFKPMKNGYFEEYAILQRICIQILENHKVGFGGTNHKINGLIFDVSWLWEEYIAIITKWDHFGRNPNLNTLRIFDNETNTSNHYRYPDFVKDSIPIDTKYKKKLDFRNDLNQIITYMYILKSNQGIFLLPVNKVEEGNKFEKLGTLAGFGGDIFIYKFYIPQGLSSYDEFQLKMNISEKN